jgi:hypothetical protein
VEVPRGLRGPAVHRRRAIAAVAVLTCSGLRGKIQAKERAGVAGERRRSSRFMRRS